MNILVFRGSPRRGGNTDMLLGKMHEGIASQGQDVEFIDLPELDIHPCIGCGKCEKKGDCIFNDDMQEMYTKIGAATRIVIASPIYFYGVTAQAKLFIDRCQALWSRKFIMGEVRPDRQLLKGYFVSVSATSGGKIFEGAALTARYAFDAMDFTFDSELLIRGVDKKGAMADHPEHLEEAFQFGQNICAQ